MPSVSKSRSRLLLLASFALLVVLTLAAPAGAYECGPGAHWVDTCVGGFDDFGSPTSTATVTIELYPYQGSQLTLTLSGLTQILRQSASDDSSNFPGKYGEYVDGHLDAIDTEIVSMNLTDGTFNMWAGAGTSPYSGEAMPPSRGVIVEHTANSSLANSYFEVFIEVDITSLMPGTYVYNHVPHPMQALGIEGVPLSEMHSPPRGAPHTVLWTDPILEGAEYEFGRIISSHLAPGPANQVPSLSPVGIALLGGLVFALAVGGLAVQRRRRAL
jgi:hypothetical protein